ncbi:hypothetical protein BRD14_01280 [Halobacteriales archaeon SW_5_68_122]|nr:MAG: hypothetical protein BRD14_01280 [Halobacteriales archaeon SW_5_68_122]
MLTQTHRVTLSVRVPRGAAGDVDGGVESVVGDVDGVEYVEVHDLAGVRPNALDLHVDAAVTVELDADVADPGERLRDGFGVLAVD